MRREVGREAATAAPLMPAEWEPHERTLMAWPVRATERTTWFGRLEQARAEYAAVARAVAAFEPVLMVCEPGAAGEVRRLAGAAVEVLEAPLDDSWLRDSGPIVARAGGERVAVDFRFNAWGGRGAWQLDDQVSRRLAAHLGIPRRPVDMVLEGGSISVDGRGTLITTEQCLLNPNRNPRLDRAGIERRLAEHLGATTVIWLPLGSSEMSVTDGHVDGVCAFVGPGRVVVQTARDPSHPSHARLAQNVEALRAARDAGGAPLDLVELPELPLVDSPRGRIPVLAVNFFLVNGGCVVPVSGTPADADNLAVLAAALPDREVVPVQARTLALGGGGVHCITQQLPAAA